MKKVLYRLLKKKLTDVMNEDHSLWKICSVYLMRKPFNVTDPVFQSPSYKNEHDGEVNFYIYCSMFPLFYTVFGYIRHAQPRGGAKSYGFRVFRYSGLGKRVKLLVKRVHSREKLRRTIEIAKFINS